MVALFIIGSSPAKTLDTCRDAINRVLSPQHSTCADAINRVSTSILIALYKQPRYGIISTMQDGADPANITKRYSGGPQSTLFYYVKE